MGNLREAKPRKPFRIFDFVWRRTPLIVVLGVPLFLGLLVLSRFFVSPTYRVDGLFLIHPLREPQIEGRDREVIEGDVGYYQRTVAYRLTNRDILIAALERLPEEDRPEWLRGLGTSDRAVYRLMGRLQTEQIERTYLIRAQLDAGEAEGLALVLRTVMETLVEKLSHEQERRYEARLGYLREEREKVAGRAVQERERLLELADSVENRAFLHNAYTAHLNKLELIQKLYWEAEAEALQAQGELEEARLDQLALPKLSLAPFARERVFDNFGINQVERWTYEKSQELRSAIDGLTPQNPERQYVEQRMEAMNEYLEEYKKAFSDSTILNLTEKRQFELDTNVVEAESAYQAARQVADRLQNEYQEAAEEASRVSQAIFEAEGLAFGFGDLRERLASINSRIDDAELQAKAPLPVSIDQLPSEPESPAETNARKLQMLAFVLSFGLIGGGCLAFDWFDGRIRCREDLAAAIGGPGAEPVPAVPTGGASLAEWLLAHPEHPAAVAMREMAVRLLLERDHARAKLVAMCGAHHGAGNSSLALGLARALAMHGGRVLLVEMPTSHPGLASLAGMEASPSAPWGAEPLSDPASAALLLPWHASGIAGEVRAGMPDFLARAREHYDLVLFDLAPVGESDIAHLVATQSDVVVVTAKQDGAQYAQVRQAVEWAAAAQVPAVTAWLNFARADRLKGLAFSTLGLLQKSASRWHGQFDERLSRFSRSRNSKPDIPT